MPRASGFTLAEVVMAVFIAGLLFGGVLLSYTQGTYRAEWSGRALAAQALALQQVEETRAAEWDLSNGNDEITNISLISKSITGNYPLITITGYSWTNLDLPISGSNYIQATNFVTIQGFYGSYNNSSGQQVKLKFVRVDTVWPLTRRGKTTLFTNTVCSYIAPDN